MSTRTTTPVLVSDVLNQAVFSGSVRIISDKGVGVISNNGSSLVSKIKYQLEEASGTPSVPAQAYLANAEIDVLDAAGNAVTDASGKPVTTTTDAAGHYQFTAALPTKGLVMRVKLATGGELLRLLPKDERSGSSVDIDTASSLGASYVLNDLVKQQQNLLDKLSTKETAPLQSALEAAQAKAPAQVPTYQPQDEAAEAQALRAQVPSVDQAIHAIEALLLAGSGLGDGKKALAVALDEPVKMIPDGAGGYYVAEHKGRVRHIDASGTISTYAGGGSAFLTSTPQPATQVALGTIAEMALGADGSLYLALTGSNGLARVTPDDKVALILGDGHKTIESATTGGDPLQTSLVSPRALAIAANGTVYSGDAAIGQAGAIKGVTPDGKLDVIALPATTVDPKTGATAAMPPYLAALAIAPDGTFYALLGQGKGGAALYERTPAGDWKPLGNTPASDLGDVAVDAQGKLYAAGWSRVALIDAQGKPTVVAGDGNSGDSGDGGPATAAEISPYVNLDVESDGTVLLADSGDGLVRAILPDGTITTLAGTRAASQVGDAAIVALNSPTGLALDPQGRLVIAQSGSSTLTRVENGKLSIIAGTGQAGAFQDGAVALKAPLYNPGAIAYSGDTLYFLQSDTSLDRLDPDGTLHRVVYYAGPPVETSAAIAQFSKGPFLPANQCFVNNKFALAFDPSGRPVWSDTSANQICRLDDDGRVELIAGDPTGVSGDAGDGGPANQAKFCYPTAIAYDKAGNLYIADTGNLRIRKIDTAGNISTIAGIGGHATELAVMAGQPLTPADGADPLKSVIAGPAGLCFGADGTLYFAEVGSAALAYQSSLAHIPAALIPNIPPRICKITPDGKLHLIAGADTPLLNDPNDPVNSLSSPGALLIDGQGRLVIEDADAGQIKLLPAGSF